MASKRQCPNCNVSLTRYQWSRLWWMSSMFSGRLVEPCAECGSLLRLSSMTVVAGVGALGLFGTAAALFLWDSQVLQFVALVFTVIILVGVLGTRVESAPVRATALAAQPGAAPHRPSES